MQDESIIKMVTIIVLGVLLFTSIVGITVVAVTTDRDVRRAEALTFVGSLVVATLGGISWFAIRKHRRWRVKMERENGEGSD